MNITIGKYRFSIGLNILVAAVTAVLIFVLLLTAFSVLQPKIKELTKIGKEISQKETEIELNQNYFVRLRDTKTELDKYQPELSKIDSSLPNDALVPDFLGFLQGATSQSGLLLQKSGSFVTSPSSNFPLLQETTFSVGVAGSYGAFKTFLNSLEKSARVIEVNSITFSPGTASAAGGRTSDFFNFDLSVKTYSY